MYQLTLPIQELKYIKVVIWWILSKNWIVNIFIIAKYPGYEDAQRQDAQSEIKDYLAANPAFASTLVTGGMTTFSFLSSTASANDKSGANNNQSFNV